MEIFAQKIDRREETENEINYWKNKTPVERLNALCFLVSQYVDGKSEFSEGLPRVYKITQRS